MRDKDYGCIAKGTSHPCGQANQHLMASQSKLIPTAGNPSMGILSLGIQSMGISSTAFLPTGTLLSGISSQGSPPPPMPSDPHSAPFHLRPNITSHSQANSRDLSYPSQPKEDPRSAIPHSKWLNRGSLLTDNTLSLPDAVRKGTTTPTSPLPAAIAAAVGIKIDPILTHRAPRSQKEEQQQACRRDCEDASDRLCRSPAHPTPSPSQYWGPRHTHPLSLTGRIVQKQKKKKNKSSVVRIFLSRTRFPAALCFRGSLDSATRSKHTRNNGGQTKKMHPASPRESGTRNFIVFLFLGIIGNFPSQESAASPHCMCMQV